MRLGNASILGMALVAAVAMTACNRADETASTYDEPAATTDQPAATSTTPAATATPTQVAGTNTAATDAEAPTSTAPVAAANTMADATTLFDDMDVNNDSGISQDELPDSHPLRQAFTVVDSDGNGLLSRAEVDSYRAKTPPPGG